MLDQLVISMVRSRQAASHQYFDTVTQACRVLPQHIDFNMHINNARYLEFLERGRWNHSVKTGMFRPLMKKRFNFIVAGIEITYVRELRLFQRFDLETTLLGWDEKYFYMEQRCVVDGKLHAHALVKAVFMQNGRPADSLTVCKALDLSGDEQALPEHMDTWKQLAAEKRAYAA